MSDSSAVARITLIVKGDPLTPVAGSVGLLIDSAPDAALPFSSFGAPNISELLGSFDDAKLRAWELAQKLIADERPMERVRQLRVSEEVIIRELESIFLSIHLDRWLSDHNVEECRFRAPSPWIGRLREIQRASLSTYRIEAPEQISIGKFEKFRRLVHLDGTRGLRQGAILAARHFFPNVARYLSSPKNAKHSQTHGGWWFYSTAYTYTNIGLAYEPYMPSALHYICEDAATGGAPLRERGRDFLHLYTVASLGDLPRPELLSRAQSEFVRLLSSVTLEGDEAVARDVLLSGSWFQTWLKRILPFTLFQSRILTRWIADTRPEAIVVGNAAYEGVLLQLASQAGIPTVLLQHGILGDYYQLMDYPADALLVRGEFWRDFVSASMRNRTHVLNVPFEATSQATESSDILFLTSVDSALPNTHERDFHDIVSALIRAAYRGNRRLVVRIHPRENLALCRAVVAGVCQELQMFPDVSFSSGAGLEEVLRSSAVAVTYCSTVFLDCLRLGIPIISFEWHDFSYKNLLKAHSVFNFARDLAHLQELVHQGLSGDLPVPSSYNDFMAPTERSALASFFRELPKLNTRSAIAK